MNYYCEYIDETLREKWEKVVKRNRAAGFHQSFEWAKFKNQEGWDTYKIGIFDKNTNEMVGGTIMMQFSFSNGTDFLYIPE
ncbi:MAG: peptidoglycan bridge formation glycyltransferase FemA/FemB family protein, partial [Candidatus Gracilibacteria bacterium]